MSKVKRMTGEWLSVAEYAKRLNLKTPQVVYNWIATGKLKKDVQWREIKLTLIKKEVWYDK